MSAIEDVLKERSRQMIVHGWTIEHDDEHTDFSLAAAASCYANPMQILVDGGGLTVMGVDDEALPLGWPETWDDGWWKPSEYRRNLVKAAALLIAEIERIDRLN